jgi:hypothetical protein
MHPSQTVPPTGWGNPPGPFADRVVRSLRSSYALVVVGGAVFGRIGRIMRASGRRLNDAPGQQTALLPHDGQWSSKEREHVGWPQRAHGLQSFALAMLDEHRCRRLAHATPFTLKVNVFNPPAGVDAQFDSYPVSAQWVGCFVTMRRERAGAAVKWLFVVIENPVLVKRIIEHGNVLRYAWASSLRVLEPLGTGFVFPTLLI